MVQTLPAIPNTFILACDAERTGYSSVYRVIGWRTLDGITFQPVAQCIATINEMEANGSNNPGGTEWSIGNEFNRGAEVLTEADERTFYHVHAHDMRIAWEDLDAYRAAHYEYEQPAPRVGQH